MSPRPVLVATMFQSSRRDGGVDILKARSGRFSRTGRLDIAALGIDGRVSLDRSLPPEEFLRPGVRLMHLRFHHAPAVASNQPSDRCNRVVSRASLKQHVWRLQIFFSGQWAMKVAPHSQSRAWL